MANELNLYRGDSVLLNVTVTKESDDSAYDLTDAEVTFSVRATEDGTALLTKTVGSGVTLTDPTHGKCTVKIEDGDTGDMAGKYVYDIQVSKGGDVYTVAKSTLKITKDVSHT